MSWQPNCCCGCSTTCSNCANNKAPCEWQVEISGYTRFGSTSCTCENINATHVTGFSDAAGCNSPAASASMSGSGCTPNVEVFVSVLFESGVYKLRVLVVINLQGFNGSGYQEDVYEAHFGSKPDCMSFVDEECTYVTTNYGNIYGQKCNPASSVFVTAL